MSKPSGFDDYNKYWMSDPNIRRCSRAARGMWMDMLCLMSECEDRGVLITGGVPWLDEEITGATGGDLQEGLSCLAELLRKGVAERNSLGAIFSPLMVRDEEHKRANRERVYRHRKKKDCNAQSNANVTPDVMRMKREGNSEPPPDPPMYSLSLSNSGSSVVNSQERESKQVTSSESERELRGESEGGCNAEVMHRREILAIYREFWPESVLSISSQDQLVGRMEDVGRARLALHYAAINNISPRRISTMVEIYENRDYEPNSNGRSKRPTFEDNDEYIRSLGDKGTKDRSDD